MRDGRAWWVLFALAILWVVALLHRGEPLAWDEIEFYRATRWIAEGQLPFRDYWEHHMPLQWLLFAPLAKLFGGGAGVASVVALRWAQLPLWITIIAAMIALARREGIEPWARWCALVLLLAAPAFVRSALQYRVDVLGNAAFVIALGIAPAFGRPRAGAGVNAGAVRFFLFGALMSLAVLANMRLAPIVILAAALVMFDGWRWNPQALWMFAGIAIIATTFVIYLVTTASWAHFVEGVIRYNVVSDRLFPPEANTFFQRLLAPFAERDIAAVAFWIAGVIGTVLALRDIRRPGALQILAILATASIVLIAFTGVQYPYHFQLAYILMIPLAAAAIAHLAPKWRPIALLVAAVALLVDLIPIASPAFGAGMREQDLVMKTADRVATGRVWDGVGYALRKRPAYRYWFLPAGVRLMAEARLIEPYDIREIASNPPDAIVYNLRVHFWMMAFPRLGHYVVRHYVPLRRNLWIPGLSAQLPARPGRIAWIVPKTGRYDIWSSELLAKHAWIARPMDYGLIEGERAAEMQIPLKRLPPLLAGALQWRVDGNVIPVTTKTLDLRAGSRLELYSATRAPAGVLVVPHGIDTLCAAPAERFVF